MSFLSCFSSCCLITSVFSRLTPAALLKLHSAELNPNIIKGLNDSSTGNVVEEVCEALLDVDPHDYVRTALPDVLPMLITERSLETLVKVWIKKI